MSGTHFLVCWKRDKYKELNKRDRKYVRVEVCTILFWWARVRLSVYWSVCTWRRHHIFGPHLAERISTYSTRVRDAGRCFNSFPNLLFFLSSFSSYKTIRNPLSSPFKLSHHSVAPSLFLFNVPHITLMYKNTELVQNFSTSVTSFSPENVT